MPKDKTKEKKEKKDKSGKGKKKKDKGKDKKKKDKPELEIRSYVPVEMKCPFCKKNMTTKVVYSTQRSTNALVVMNIISGCLPCILRLTGSFRDAQHSCSKCKKPIAINSW